MTRTLSLVALVLAACQPPPAAQTAPKRVMELYMHPNGLSRCVDQEGDQWKVDPSCCPTGWEAAGFTVPAAIEYEKGEDGVKRTLYRHVVCLEQ